MSEVPSFQIISEDDTPTLTPEQVQEQKEKRANELAEFIVNRLQADLAANSLTERVTNLPVLQQEFGTDCAIANARMALVQFGHEDNGTKGFIEEANNLGITVPTTKDATGKEGPRADITIIQPILARYGISARLISGPEAGEQFVEALKSGNPVQLSIDFHVLHPNDTSELVRNHAVMAKGYRLKDNQDIILVANDPKPTVGGELEINRSILEKALDYPFTIYTKT